MRLMIIGLGLIGGSIAKRIKQTDRGSFICAVDSDERVLQQALADGVIDRGYQSVSPEDTDYELVLAAVPPHSVADLLKEIAPRFQKETVFTDVCSVKDSLQKELSSLDICYIGGHPMAGTEQTGYGGSYAHLFENAYYILTKDHPLMRRFVEMLGAVPIVMDSRTHDHAVGTISHVPHVISAALVNLAVCNETADHKLIKIAAGGFRDITRISSSSEDLWQDIVTGNREEILALLCQYEAILSDFRKALQADDRSAIRAFFRAAREYRQQLEENREELQPKYFDIYLSVRDRVGVIRDIAQLLTEGNISIKNIGVLKSREQIGGTLQLSVYSKEDFKKARELLQAHGFDLVSP